MTDSFFIDTNIFIYAYSTTELTKKDIARNLLTDNIQISIQIVNEFIWIMTKKYSVDLGSIKNIVKGFFNIYEVHSIDQKIIEKALEISEKYKYSYWDSFVLASALSGGSSILYSEDMHHNQIIEDKLRILNPFIEKKS